MVKKHGTYSNRKRKEQRQLPTWIFIVIILGATLLYVLSTFLLPQGNESTVLVEINGEAITQEELDLAWGQIPPQFKINMTQEDVRVQLEQRTLLLQEVQKRNLSGEEEYEQFLAEQSARYGVPPEAIEESLRSQGVSIAQVQDDLAIGLLLEERVGESINITEEEILGYYQEHQEQFFRDEEVSVRHILIANNTSGLVETIEENLSATASTSFCELVNEYSIDLASRETCGEYTFGRGVMVPEFETAGFTLEVGERTRVESQFGIHIIEKLGESPSGYIGLNSTVSDLPGQPTVSELIEEQLLRQSTQEIFDIYVAELREEAEITYFN